MAKNTTQARELNLKLYLEGIQIPVENIQLNENLKQTTSCIIRIPLNDKALEIKSRTTVHLFYKDTLTEGRWLLLFEGEVAGISLSRAQDTRTVVLNCTHISNHWNFVTKDGTILEGGAAKTELATKIHVTFPTNYETLTVPADVKEFGKVLEAVSSEVLKDILKEAKKIVAGGDIGQYFLDVKNVGVGVFGILTHILKNLEFPLVSYTKQITENFAKSNLGYGPFHATYQIIRRIYGFENSKLNNLLQSKALNEFVKKTFITIPDSINLNNMLEIALNKYNYKLLKPTSPTYNEVDKTPQSFIVIPTPTHLTPPACNVFFKDEVIRADYSRNFLMEPTRVASFLYPTLEKDSNLTEFTTKSFQKLILSPSGRFNFDPILGNPTSFQLTREERLRGVNASFNFSDFSEMKSGQDAQDQADIEEHGTSKEDKDKNIKLRNEFYEDLRFKYADLKYQTEVLSARTFSLTAQFSPYRFCGLPGMYIDTVLPSVIGLVSEISTVIDAQGSAISKVIFAYPKTIRKENSAKIKKLGNTRNSELDGWLIYSGWTKAEVVSKDPNYKELRWPFEPGAIMRDGKKLGEGYSKAHEKYWISWLKHKMTNPEDSTFLNTWYDENTYFPNKIGEKVYKQLMYGVVSGTSNLDGEANTVENKYFTTQDKSLDGSIGKFREDTVEFEENVFDNRENTQWLAHFIRTLQEAYTKTSNTQKHIFINRFTRRRIITESEFWKFLLNLPENKSIKDIGFLKEKINDKETNNFVGIRDISISLQEERARLKAIILDNKSRDGNTASAPFIKERRDAVNRLKNDLLVSGEYFIDSVGE